ncbi:hypothetical protein BVRB_4g082600 [Beta vulgaris subsp. vulgaris]|nr:hypothetical protein BVRB_4g082600 [Beta vulgaris subsp. vulgaris]
MRGKRDERWWFRVSWVRTNEKVRRDEKVREEREMSWVGEEGNGDGE